MDLFRHYFAEANPHRTRSNVEKIRFIRGYFAQKASGYRFKNKNSLLIFSTVSWPFSSLHLSNKNHLSEIVALHIFPMQLHLERQPYFLESHEKLA